MYIYIYIYIYRKDLVENIKKETKFDISSRLDIHAAMSLLQTMNVQRSKLKVLQIHWNNKTNRNQVVILFQTSKQLRIRYFWLLTYLIWSYYQEHVANILELINGAFPRYSLSTMDISNFPLPTMVEFLKYLK